MNGFLFESALPPVFRTHYLWQVFEIKNVQTKLFQTDPDAKNIEPIRAAAQVLRSGGIVAFPTETVYGLGADALCESSVRRIFEAKGRPADNPLIVHIDKVDRLQSLVAEVPDIARRLIDRFWPGPMTLLLKKTSAVPDVVTAGLPTVGVRMPNHPVALMLLSEAGIPVCAPSANLSGKPSPTEFAHVYDDLNGRADALLDGGRCGVGVESTVIDVSSGNCEILRPGGVSLEQIRQVVPNATVYFGKNGEAPKSPGMKYRHYSPRAAVTVVCGEPDRVAAYINDHCQEDCLVLAFEQNRHRYAGKTVLSLGDQGCLSEAAERLFRHFRTADGLGVRRIFCEDAGTNCGMGLALRNRLYKASEEVIEL